MPFSPADIISGFVVPATFAVLVASMWRRRITAESGRQLGTILAFISGFHAGYWLLGLGPVRPEAHWQWLPWLLCLTLFAGLPPFSGRSAMSARLGLTVFIAALSGWLLVPAWEHLEPSRTIHLAAFGAAVLFSATALQPLTIRVPPVWVMASLTGSLAAGAVILALAGSLRFAQMAGCGVAALLGMIAAARLDKGRISTDALVLPYTLLVTALMMIGRVNSFSDVPLVSYLLVTFAPLSLWLATNDRIAATGVRRCFILSLPLVLCGVAVGFALAGELTSEKTW